MTDLVNIEQAGADEQLVARLAAELAANLRPAAEILTAHGVDKARFKTIAATPQFRQLYSEAKRLWHTDTNANERVRQKAVLALEEMLIPLVQIVHDHETSPAAKLEGIKVTTKLAGMEKPDAAISGGPGFSVTINIPGQPAATIEATRVEEDDE